MLAMLILVGINHHLFDIGPCSEHGNKCTRRDHDGKRQNNSQRNIGIKDAEAEQAKHNDAQQPNQISLDSPKCKNGGIFNQFEQGQAERNHHFVQIKPHDKVKQRK